MEDGNYTFINLKHPYKKITKKYFINIIYKMPMFHSRTKRIKKATLSPTTTKFFSMHVSLVGRQGYRYNYIRRRTGN